jgi:signal transduction histidine kinase
MGFSSGFRANVLLRVLFLLALCWILAWSLFVAGWVATPIFCGALLVLVTINLTRYVERTANEFRTFLELIAHRDYSTPISLPYKGRVFRELQEAYRVLARELTHLNREKAANLQYLEAVIDHVSVALCCFDEDGIVRMQNGAARRLFTVPHLNSRQTFALVDARLPAILQQLSGGERMLLSVRQGDDVLQLLLYATDFTLLDRRYRLVSFQNIRDELDRQETTSWQKLIRVLTHEIMNSVTPIVSLSRLLQESMLDESRSPPALRTFQGEEQDDMLRSVAAIHTRSSGLLDFVRAYRSFASLPEPTMAEIQVDGLLERVRTLMSQESDAKGVVLEVQCAESGLRICVDAAQTEQVLINLIRNALEAMSERSEGRIRLRCGRASEDEVLLQIIDNGAGISRENLESIFIPFFTTKRNGTGVGLSISRQLVQMNRGLITVRSEPGVGSTFTLKYPALRLTAADA